jgi:hypothetical protein
MSNKYNDLLDDNRSIKALLFDEDDSIIAVGQSKVEKIEVYGEPGEFCYRPWFAVYRSGVIAERINAFAVSIVAYTEDK